MAANIYYILQLPDPALNAILSHCVEDTTSLRRSLNGKKAVVKLPVGATEPPALNGFQSYTHEEILAEMQKVEWLTPEE